MHVFRFNPRSRCNNSSPHFTIRIILLSYFQQREHIGEAVFGVRPVVGEIWVLFVLLGEALLHRDLIGL